MRESKALVGTLQLGRADGVPDKTVAEGHGGGPAWTNEGMGHGARQHACQETRCMAHRPPTVTAPSLQPLVVSPEVKLRFFSVWQFASPLHEWIAR